MKTLKIGVVLLALLLAGMVMIPTVSAENENVVGREDSSNIEQSVSFPEHNIPSDYPQDSKPAQWLSESDMINFVLSQDTVKMDQNTQSGIIHIPVSYLETETNFISTEKNPTFFSEGTLKPDDRIVLVRIPRQMYERFVNNAKDGKLSLPVDYFVRYYENSDDLYSHLKTVGNTLQVLPSEKYPLKKFTDASDAELQLAKEPSLILPGKVNAVLSYPQKFFARRHYDLIESENYDYCIGQITPDSWTLLGSAHDKFDIFQEREYRFDSFEAIEIVVKYRDRDQGSDIILFPALYRSGAEEPITPSQWVDWDGNIGVDKNDLPYAYGYHVQFTGGYYFIDIEDMETMNFIGSYTATAAAGTSSFTDLWGSSEYRQRAAPTTNIFSATTKPVVDEWAHISDGDWEKPENVWHYVSPAETDSYVRVLKTFDSSGNLITRSYAEYP